MSHGLGLGFTLEEEVFLLALRIKCPSLPNTDVVAKLKDFHNSLRLVCSGTMMCLEKPSRDETGRS
jgi:hypothetical protein